MWELLEAIYSIPYFSTHVEETTLLIVGSEDSNCDASALHHIFHAASQQ